MAAAESPAPSLRDFLDLAIITRGRVAVIGLGGIGSILATYLALFLASLRGVRVKLALVDGDAFEERNRERMAFDDLDNKAVVVGRGLGRRFGRPGLSIRPVDRFVTEENVAEVIAEGDLVFACVDNHATRKLIDDRCASLRDVVLISGGNDGVEGGLRGTAGNVQVRVREEGADVTAGLAAYHPEIREPRDLPPSASCEELAASSAPQILFANLAAASAMLNAFWRLLQRDDLGPMYDEVCFDVLEGVSRPHRYGGEAPAGAPATP